MMHQSMIRGALHTEIMCTCSVSWTVEHRRIDTSGHSVLFVYSLVQLYIFAWKYFPTVIFKSKIWVNSSSLSRRNWTLNSHSLPFLNIYFKNYQITFPPNMAAIVLIILTIFHNNRASCQVRGLLFWPDMKCLLHKSLLVDHGHKK